MSAWLEVPLADYEGHMQAPGVEQLSPLSRIFSETLRRHDPSSVIVLGVAGGNGLEHIVPGTTRRVVGVDVNAAYLDATRARFPQLEGLDLVQLDLRDPCAPAAALGRAALVHAAMIFEHTGLEPCLTHASSLVEPGGILSVVLQLPSPDVAAVAATPFPSMRLLASDFTFIDPSSVERALATRAFALAHSTSYQLPSGKAFWAACFRAALPTADTGATGRSTDTNRPRTI